MSIGQVSSREGFGASEQPIRVLVVDDEPLVRRRISRLLRTESNLELVAECKGGLSAVEQIRALAPDLVFLDIQMPDLDGFGVIAQVGVEAMPSVVFITAFDQYAIRAFEVHALDYLLKPFDDARFFAALERAKSEVRFREERRLPERLAALLAERDSAPRYWKRVAIPSGNATRVIEVEKIDWIAAEDYYVRVHCGKESYLWRESLGTLEERLDPSRFLRVHRSAIVNLGRLRELHSRFKGDAVVVLEGGVSLPVSRSRRKRVKAVLSGKL
jgi:two-component system, LytTR family, response regulator